MCSNFLVVVAFEQVEAKNDPIAVRQFSDGFIGSLKQLEAASTSADTTKDTIFNEFYQEWGSHYISDSKFGAKLIVQRRYSKSKVCCPMHDFF